MTDAEITLAVSNLIDDPRMDSYVASYIKIAKSKVTSRVFPYADAECGDVPAKYHGTVVDVAAGHLAALEYLTGREGYYVWNLGTGTPISVLELVAAFEKASGTAIPYEIAARRPGDVAACYADVSKAARDLGWTATRTLEEACADSFRWQSANPNGYATDED